MTHNCYICKKDKTLYAFNVCEHCVDEIENKLIMEFLKDWGKIWAVKPIEDVYIHFTITKAEYKNIKEKWEKRII